MNIEIDENSGFCFGVVKAISKAEIELEQKGYVNSLGDIVHNKMEVQRLTELGLMLISHSTLSEAKGDTIFIRAHGEPPKTYQEIKKLGYNIVDATCPVVAKLQKQVIIAYKIMQPVNGQVVIFGKRGHAEVVGLSGQIDDNCIIIESIDELNSLVDFSRPIYLLSQTTQPLSIFHELKKVIEDKKTETTADDFYIVKDTICRNVSNREPYLREFAARFDLVLFVSGVKSSNGKALHSVCLEVNSNSKKIENELGIDNEWLNGVESIGICGATSTPRWLMDRIYHYLSHINK